MTVPVSDRLEVRADGLLQVDNNVTHNGRALVRAVLLAKLSDRVSVGGGYAWTRVEFAGGGGFVEHRAVQEFDFHTPIAAGAVTFLSRTRFEERRQEKRSGTAFRLRQQTRLDVPLGRRGVTVVVWDEYFHSFNKTSWSGRTGPSLMLNFVGIHLPIAENIAVESGYLNQTNFTAGRNETRHIMALFFSAHL